jgi:ribonuclease HI
MKIVGGKSVRKRKNKRFMVRRGYGVVLLHPKKRAEASGGFRLTTNNRMEIQAAIKGLELLKQPCKVTLYSDSQYLVDAIMKAWAVKWKKNDWWLNNKERAKNIDLWEKLLPLCETHQVEFRWVKGHAGIHHTFRWCYGVKRVWR